MSDEKSSPVGALREGVRQQELASVLLLLRLKVAAMERVSAQLVEFGSAVRVLQDATKENLIAAALTEDDITRAIAEVTDWTDRQHLDVRTIFDATYPSNLLSIFNNPPWLFVKGVWNDDRDSRSIAVVGTRKPTPEGIRRARIAATKFATAEITVISGLAAGIDTAAHTAALDARGRTVAVMGTGINTVYPKENARLATRIVESGGALVSQFMPSQPPTQWTFPMRNVVMSGLSAATLVIEASATSGAKSQARHALEHGRTVFLPKSLVTEHEWAQQMVSEGVHGVRAVQVDSPDEIVDRVLGALEAPALAV
jgi:DNA processing protein